MIFHIETSRLIPGDPEDISGAFTVSCHPSDPKFLDRAEFQFRKKLEAMVRVWSGRPKPGDVEDIELARRVKAKAHG